jgi:dihydropteroate synthase
MVMGIVNVTPDSFSDGGQFYSVDRAVEHALQLAAEGADFLDIGGESTRPRATPVTVDEELKRVLPVIEKLKGLTETPISIDTQKPSVAREALLAGASIVNDVAANRAEPEMWETVAEFRAGYVLMHMQGTPETMQSTPQYKNVVREVRDFFSERLAQVRRSGVSPEYVLLDVGIGFGKTADHNLELLGGLEHFKLYQRPMLLGVSRKSFIAKVAGGEVQERLGGSLACAAWAVQQGVNMIRTHDVAATLQAVRMIEAIMQRQPE